MPIFKVSTKEARSIWRSPDGQREIFEVILDFEGKDMLAKTYSKDISVAGFTGEVESYEKEGRNGIETFVKQAPKEGASSYGGGNKGYGKSYGGKPQGDQFTMYLSYAKDLAVALVATKDGFDATKYAELLESVDLGGKQLYEGRPGAETKSETLDIVTDPDTINKAELDSLFDEPKDNAEKPWTEKS